MRKLFQVWNSRIGPSQAGGWGISLRTTPQCAGSLKPPLSPVISYSLIPVMGRADRPGQPRARGPHAPTTMCLGQHAVLPLP